LRRPAENEESIDLANNVYECLFILDSNRYARDAHAVVATLTPMIENLGGEILANRLWTEQKLAYSIKGHRKGTYWLTYFRLESHKLTEFNRACQLNENVVRHMVIRVDARLVEVLVSHALGKRSVPEQTAAAAPEGAVAAAAGSPTTPE